ncbi:MAG TPA: hypothetical protein VFW80_09835 [Gaiellaceae bacterium]|nr:hypothetical protein [Gaiellaceae bacterium]
MKHVIAVRIRPNVVLPELELGPDRSVPISDAPDTRTSGDALWRKLAAVIRALRLDGDEVRRRLSRDPRYAAYEGLELPPGRRFVTEDEARRLVALGLADPVHAPPAA